MLAQIIMMAHPPTEIAAVAIIDYPALPQRERILKIAAQLFALHGYHGVGMSDLQKAVGLGRGALYHHIRSKEDLLYEILREYIQELGVTAESIRDAEVDPVRRVALLGRHLVHKIASNQAELTVCFKELHSLTADRHREVLGYHARYERIWRECMEEGALKGQFRPYNYVVFKGILGMYFYSYLWMQPSLPQAADDISVHFVELTLRMLAP